MLLLSLGLLLSLAAAELTPLTQGKPTSFSVNGTSGVNASISFTIDSNTSTTVLILEGTSGEEVRGVICNTTYTTFDACRFTRGAPLRFIYMDSPAYIYPTSPDFRGYTTLNIFLFAASRVGVGQGVITGFSGFLMMSGLLMSSDIPITYTNPSSNVCKFFYFICGRDVDLTITRTGTMNTPVYLSYTQADVTEATALFTVPPNTASYKLEKKNLRYPSFLYFTTECVAPWSFSITSESFDITKDKYYEFSVAPFSLCYNHFIMENLNIDLNFTAVTSEVRNKSVYSLEIFTTHKNPPAYKKNYQWRGISGVQLIKSKDLKEFNAKTIYMSVGTSRNIVYLPSKTFDQIDTEKTVYGIYYSQTNILLPPGALSMILAAAPADVPLFVTSYKRHTQLNYLHAPRSYYGFLATTSEPATTDFSFAVGVNSESTETWKGQTLATTDAVRQSQICIPVDDPNFKPGSLYFTHLSYKCTKASDSSADDTCKFAGNVSANHIYIIDSGEVVIFHPSWLSTGAQPNVVDSNAYHLTYLIKDPSHGFRLTIRGSIPEVAVYMSHDACLPTKQTAVWAQSTTDGSKDLRDLPFTIPAGDAKLRAGQLYISLETRSTITARASGINEDMTPVIEYIPVKGVFTSKTAVQSLYFDPVREDVAEHLYTNPYTVMVFEIPVNQTERAHLVAYIGLQKNPGPTNSILTLNPFMAHISKGSLPDTNATPSNQTAYLRVNADLRTPPGGDYYINVVCEGTDCGTDAMGSLSYLFTAITADTMESGVLNARTIVTRPTGMPQTFMYDLNDNENSVFTFKVPTTDLCKPIEYTVVSCIGQVPVSSLGYDPSIINHLVDVSCVSEKISGSHVEEEGDEVFEMTLDSSHRNIAAGRVYVMIIPDITNVTAKNKTELLTCTLTGASLYLNEHISSFYRSFNSYTTASQRFQLANYLVATVPVITKVAAVPGANAVGDRLVVTLNSTSTVNICISSSPHNYHPNASACKPGPGSGDAGAACECDTLFTASRGLQTHFAYFPPKLYMNNKPIGNINPSTTIYIAIWADFSDVEAATASHISYSLQVTPQAVLPEGGDPFRLRFGSRLLKMLDRYISFAFLVTPETKPALVVGPFIEARDKVPKDFYKRQILTMASFQTPIPTTINSMYRIIDGGLQALPIEVSKGVAPSNVSGKVELYATIEYLQYDTLSNTDPSINSTVGGGSYFKTMSDIFTIYVNTFYGQRVNTARFGRTFTMRKSGKPEDKSADSILASIPYTPADFLLIPCRGNPVLLVDTLTMDSSLAKGDYQVKVEPPEWGMPAGFYVGRDNATMPNGIMYYFTVLDMSIEGGKGEVTGNSYMSYDIITGDTDFRPIPGNGGFIKVVYYSEAGDGLITIRIAPATFAYGADRTYGQYYLYATAWNAKPDPAKDFSPYTACGVLETGWPLYADESGNNFIDVPREQTDENGYIELTSNLPLWNNNQTLRGLPIYITVLVRNNGMGIYHSVLSKNINETKSYVGIAVGVVIVVLLAAAGIFCGIWFGLLKKKLVIRDRKGYAVLERDDHPKDGRAVDDMAIREKA